MEKLTKREKVIIGVSVVAVVSLAAVAIKLQNDVYKAGAHYNKLADKLCGGGVWKATDITKAGFNLIPVNCCGKD